MGAKEQDSARSQVSPVKNSIKKRAFVDLHLMWSERRRANRLAFILFWSILMYFVVKGHVVSVGIVSDISMHPTLPEGGTYLVNRYIYHFVLPERGDIVVVQRNADDAEEYVKRIVGLPGETMTIRGGRVYIDGRPLDEPYVVGPTYPDTGPVTIGGDVYFVLGDNREVSEDSRAFGPARLTQIRGKIRPGELFPLR